MVTTPSTPTPTPSVTVYKIALIGDSSVGKSTFIHRFSTGLFDKNYNPDLTVKITDIDLYVSDGPVATSSSVYEMIRFQIYDIPNVEQYQELIQECDVYFIVFDLTNKNSFNNMGRYIDIIVDCNQSVDIINLQQTKPVVFCGNKCDIPNRKVKNDKIYNFAANNGLQYYMISARTNYHFDKPFLYLVRKLKNNHDLQLAEAPAILPPTINYSIVIADVA
jgi:GTP-binding nuclear protein Ran